MTIDKAIKHCIEVAEKQEITAKSNLMEIDKIKADGILRLYDADEYESCMKCAAEHRQLAEWLKELKAYRIATYKLSRMPYEDGLKYDADEVWDLFYKLWTAEVELEVMQYAEVNADGTEENN